MQDIFFEILNPIKESTGLDIDLYSLYGDLIFSTNDEKPSYKFVYHDIDAFGNITIADSKSDITYFLVQSAANEKCKVLVGAIMGSNEVSRNYAVMVEKLLETNLVAFNSANKLDLSEKISLLLNGKLKKPQIDALAKDFNKDDDTYYLISATVKAKSGSDSEKLDELISYLQTMSDFSDVVARLNDTSLVLIKKISGVEDYSSGTDFAYILYDSILEELSGLNLKLSVGGVVKTINEIEKSYESSRFAFEFGSKFDAKGHIYSHKEYTIIKMLSEIPKESLEMYFKSLADSQTMELLGDDELMDTADAFFKNSLNISETSRNKYMHRNTLINRLDKIESITGLNIRHFNDALSFKLISTIYTLLK